ncbi:DUF4352 domain-containing protein [Sutcliffiella rhizosphaerae]|uniref:DUF4352 domain-containing protein n=1 Tax=Sutcliffiella rhizosphaerae TaxID=2880967 RepID=A0ABM8YJV3_9BACI|nr:DUF4352 domain-containing protein [Sutcliffiella rhizosphaerae]CAG9620212.1 hypothetical protein BACCIP111883_00980 [Sutcliffiella rhizosphaerae]
MKKYLTLFLLAFMVMMMTACNTDKNENTEQENQQEFAEEVDEDKVDENMVPVGETAITEGGSFTFHARNSRLKPIETESFYVNIDSVSAISGELDGGFKEYLEMDEIQYIQVNIEVENKSTTPLNFDAYQASIVTSTGEEIEVPNPMISSQFDEKFAPEEKKQGTIAYLLEESKAEEVEWVQIIIKAPMDENNEVVGEEFNIKIKL